MCGKVLCERQERLYQLYERRVVRKAMVIVDDNSHVLTECYELLPSGRRLLMVPTLIISSDPHIHSDEDVLLPARTPVDVLQAIESVDSTDVQFTVAVNELVVSRETACRSADSAPADHVPCPDFDETSSQRKRLSLRVASE